MGHVHLRMTRVFLEKDTVLDLIAEIAQSTLQQEGFMNRRCRLAVIAIVVTPSQYTFLSPWSGISAAYSTYLQCMSTSFTSNFLLNSLYRREGDTPQLVT